LPHCSIHNQLGSWTYFDRDSTPAENRVVVFFGGIECYVTHDDI